MEACDYTGANGNFKDYSIVKKTTLNFFDVMANSNKYYTIEIHQGIGELRIFTEYGRVGKNGRKEERRTNSHEEAINEYDKIIRSKKKKGYVEVELVQATTGTEKAKEIIEIQNGVKIDTVVKKDKVEKKSKLDIRVQLFVKQIYYEAGQKLNMLVTGTFKSSNNSPLGKLGLSQIQKGREILQDIANLINRKDTCATSLFQKNLLDLCNGYYRFIPKAFGHKVYESDILIPTIEAVAYQNEILDFYEASLKMEDVIYDKENVDKQYKSLNCDIKVLEKDDFEYRRIENLVNQTKSSHHSVQLAVKNIFAVNQKNAPKLNEKCGNVQELFHGSRSANIPAILATHLKKPNKLQGVHISGAMFGPGLYFANNSTKSSQYSCSRFGGTSNKADTAFMFLADVALGKSKTEFSSKYYYDAPTGYDSVKGCKGRSLLHDEFIVYNEDQQRLKYIIEFVSYNQ